MKIAIPCETRDGETRVACVPDTVRRYAGAGAQVVVETGAGVASGFPDDAYAAVGATLAPDLEAAFEGADVILKVHRPVPDEIVPMPEGARLFCLMAPHSDPTSYRACAARRVDAFALELMPRISRAQSMDVLSSQSNLVGYRAVIEAAAIYGQVFPMMMTAAGTVAPARVFVMGAGVAGLQAIATARRLGAVVSATDVRPAAKEQVASLGAEFIAVEDDEFRAAETAAGYAKEMSEAYRVKQAELVAGHIRKQDIVITTALVPGRKAPVLVDEAMVRSMRPGSVVIDIAVEQGGNCPLSRPDQVVELDGVRVVGCLNLARQVAGDASALFARNIFNFVSPMLDADSGGLAIDWEDELVRGTCLTRDGKVVHPEFAESPQEEAS